MYDDDAEKKEARLYWLSPKGIRSCQDFIGPLRRHAVNYMSDAVFSDTVCTSAQWQPVRCAQNTWVGTCVSFKFK